MLSEGTKQFDLYDFFSVLIPGAGLIIGLFPLLPDTVPFSAATIVGVLLILGFIVGRGVHAFALVIEANTEAISHRDKFVSELQNPDDVPCELVDSFYDTCVQALSQLDLPESRASLSNGDDGTNICNTIYVLVRSAIHMDARGRSRTFQAVLDFYRSMWFVSFTLAVTYGLYAINSLFFSFFATADYTPYLSTLNIAGEYVFFTSMVVFAGAYMSFKRVRKRYRRYFVQYLFSDFMIIHE